MPLRRRGATSALLLALASIPALSTCGGGDAPDETPAAMAIVVAPPGTIQNGVVFGLKVQVTTVGGNPVDASDIPVTLAVSGGRTLNGMTTANTGSDGAAQFVGVSITGTPGMIQLTATAPQLTQVVTGNITLSAGIPATVTVIAGDSQSAEVAKAPAVALKVLVQDLVGNNVPGAGLDLLITAGSGSLHPTLQNVLSGSVVTNGVGQATISGWRLGTQAGTNRLVVSATGFGAATKANFVATGVPGPAYHFNLTTTLANELSLDLQTSYPAPYKAFVKDSFDNPIPGIGVQYSSTDSSVGTLTGTTGVTDAAGTFTLGGLMTGTVAAGFGIHVAYTGGATNNATLHTRPGPVARVIPDSKSAFSWLKSSGVGFGFRTVDRFGNRVPFVPVHATIVGGTGTLAQPDASDFMGTFSVNLGTPSAPGDVVVRAASPLVPDSTADITIHVKAPTTLVSVGPDSQVVTVGDSFPIPFLAKVTDAGGDPVSEVPVDFLFTTALTDSLGIASFRPVPSLGLYSTTQLATSAWIPGDTLAWSYRTVAGPPDTAWGCCFGTVGRAGDTLALGPGLFVHDRVGFAVAGVTVHLTTANGTLLTPDIVTDSTGFARVVDWIMDTTAGPVVVTAHVPGLPALPLSATVAPGPVAKVQILAGPASEGFAGERVGIGVTIEGRDRYNNLAAPGDSVHPLAPAGGGLAPGSEWVLGQGGRAYLDGWVLGSTVGTQQLAFQVDTAVTQFDVEVHAASPFNIELRGDMGSYGGVFRQAAYRWRRRIVADIPDIAVTITGGQCAAFQQPFSGTADDLIIDVSTDPIDGPGGILGGATPCFIRTASKLPILGVMQFDDADLPALAADGTLDDVILHEMGHVLGIGSLWATDGLVIGGGGVDPQYTGANGRGGFVTIGGAPGTNVPVENTGGQGTRDVHWRESTMPSELMTGFLSGLVNPMSAVTVRSLTDLGYTTDATTADSYTLGTAPPLVAGQGTRRINDRVGAPRFTVDASGRITPIQ